MLRKLLVVVISLSLVSDARAGDTLEIVTSLIMVGASVYCTDASSKKQCEIDSQVCSIEAVEGRVAAIEAEKSLIDVASLQKVVDAKQGACNSCVNKIKFWSELKVAWNNQFQGTADEMWWDIRNYAEFQVMAYEAKLKIAEAELMKASNELDNQEMNIRVLEERKLAVEEQKRGLENMKVQLEKQREQIKIAQTVSYVTAGLLLIDLAYKACKKQKKKAIKPIQIHPGIQTIKLTYAF